ncbi:MAG: hypothetical protein Q9200_007334 [Gallowayella weberi]
MLVLNSPRLSDADVRRFLPYLHHLSDVLWIVWEQLGEGNLKRLRYCAVEGIRPHDPTGQLISQFFMERRKTDQVSWDRRLTFDILSKEALALLVSPNRPAVARLLIHHAVVVGSRRPVVTIFTSGGKLCMIWDLVPDGADHTFGDVEAPVYCNAKDPPAYCATSEDHIPDGSNGCLKLVFDLHLHRKLPPLHQLQFHHRLLLLLLGFHHPFLLVRRIKSHRPSLLVRLLRVHQHFLLVQILKIHQHFPLVRILKVPPTFPLVLLLE